jgi:hypothetical protein
LTHTKRPFATKERDELARTVRRSQLPQIASIDARLEETPAEWKPACRAVVADDGQTIRLTLYAETGAVAAVDLDPLRAIALAGELIDAALPKLA